MEKYFSELIIIPSILYNENNFVELNQECSANEHFDQCGSDCEETCDPNENEICNMACVAKCMCNKGFVRGEKGDCIPKDNCPIPSCPNNQIWTDCKDQFNIIFLKFSKNSDYDF